MAAANQDEAQTQRAYYAQRARRYDDAHVHAGDEHHMAMSFMVGAFDYLNVRSVLDIGSGTGRVLEHLKRCAPQVERHGIEPVPELREVAYRKGISREELSEGDATQIAHADGAFDLVCAFGVLHHVRDHGRVVREMLRVARKGIFISDANNFGKGSTMKRAVKQVLHATGLWPIANLVKTGGRGYMITDGDGLAYSYSVFDDYPIVRAACRSVHVLNTLDSQVNPYRSASHVALLGIK